MEYQTNAQLNEFYQQEAQLQYQQQAMQGMGFAALPRYTATYTTTEALRQMLLAPRPKSPGEYRLHAAYRGAAGGVMAERALETGGALGKIAVESTLAAALWTPGVMLGGIVGGLALPMAAGYMIDKAGSYLGLDQAVKQFSRISDLQIASQEFMGGVYSRDPFGKRMDRGGAKEVNDFLEDYARAVKAYTGVSMTSDDLRKEVSQLSEAKLLENVRNADDFAKKFTSLKNAVTKITETLGKSFEEGVQVLGAMRQQNINPFEGQAVLDSVRRMGTQAGLDFDTTFASSMQGAMMGRQYRVAPEAGMMMGAQAAADASILYQTGAISNAMLHRLGGEEGMRERIMQNMFTSTQSPMMDLALMTSFRGGKMDFGQLYGYGSEVDVLDTFQFEGGIGDMMDFKAQRGKIISQLQEDNPLFAQTMVFRQLLNVARDSGEVFPNEDATLQFMADVSGGQFDRDSLRLILEEIKGWRTGQERARIEDRMTGISRLRDLSTEGFLGIGGALRRSEGWIAQTRELEQVVDNIRDGTFEWVDRIRRDWQNATTGVYDTGRSSVGDRLRDAEGAPIETGVQSRYYEEGLLNPSDASDVLMDFRYLGLDRALVTFGDMDDPTYGAFKSGYKPNKGTFLPASQAWWRERLAEVNKGLPKASRLPETAFDNFADREVTMQEVATEAGLVIYEDRFTNGQFVSRQEDVARIMSEDRTRATFFAKAAAIDPDEIDVSNAVNQAVANVNRDFSMDFGRREIMKIANSGMVSGALLSQKIMPLIERHTANLSPEEREQVGALVLQSQRVINKGLEKAIDNMEVSIDLGQTARLIKESDDKLDRGLEALYESYVNNDEVLRTTLGGRFRSLPAPVRAAIGFFRGDRAEDRLNNFKEFINKDNFAGVVSAYNAIQTLRSDGMDDDLILRTIIENADDRYGQASEVIRTLRDLGMGIPQFETTYEGMQEAQAKRITRRGSDKEKFLAANYGKLDEVRAEWFMTREETGLGFKEYMESGVFDPEVFEASQKRFGLTPLQTMAEFESLRNAMTSITHSQLLQSQQVIADASGENRGAAAAERPDTSEGLTGVDTTKEKMMEVFMNSIAADIQRMSNAVIAAVGNGRIGSNPRPN